MIKDTRHTDKVVYVSRFLITGTVKGDIIKNPQQVQELVNYLCPGEEVPFTDNFKLIPRFVEYTSFGGTYGPIDFLNIRYDYYPQTFKLFEHPAAIYKSVYSATAIRLYAFNYIHRDSTTSLSDDDPTIVCASNQSFIRDVSKYATRYDLYQN